MRRSAAPSKCLGKRPCFNPPFIRATKKHCSSNNISQEDLSSAPNNKQINKFTPPTITSVVFNESLLPQSTNSEKETLKSLENHMNDADCEKEEKGHKSTTSIHKTESIVEQKISSTSSRVFADVTKLERCKQMKGKFTNPSSSNRTMHQKNEEEEEEPESVYYAVLWCKMSKKKHKKWEGDAFLATRGKSVRLIDLDGKEIGKGSGYKSSELSTMDEGHTLFIGGKEIEVMNRISKEDWNSGRCFNAAASVAPSFESHAPLTHATFKGFIKPTKACSSNIKALDTAKLVPLFDPTKPDALVLPSPSPTQQWNNPAGTKGIVDVVVDPHLSKKLRPHQRQGVVFLYECVMGKHQGSGAILADDMGLGKTLQCITLIWTLLKQNPYGGSPVLRRVLIITPGSLVKNWCREFRKWLGVERIKVFAVSGEKKVQEFLHSPIYPVMIISYEMFVRSIEDVKRCKFDIMICDEGHRLKNTAIKTTTFLSSLQVKRRILLTGTPIQNDLQEFYSLIEFCNPGILGSSSSFHHVYEVPIVRSRQPDATEEDKQLGATRAAELSRITKQFVLRRSQDVINVHLPPKVENVVFCQPSSLQLQLYESILKSCILKECLTGFSNGALHLMCISAMKKLCSGPSLILPACLEADSSIHEDNSTRLYQGLASLYPNVFTREHFSVEYSGKLKVLSELLHSVHQNEPASKVVVVSAYTQTLDLLQRLCDSADYNFCRLDGSTPTAKRQNIVEHFNSSYSNDFVFLLSSKAGGVGLNLIGASRLVLYDVDWNPANDLQAMARIWRDGQMKKVHIYRLLTTGTIEEKIYQRQISKQGLSGAIVDANINTKTVFSTEELKDLFTLHTDSSCVTHDLLTCSCSSNKQPNSTVEAPRRRCQLGDKLTPRSISMDELLKWQHIPVSKGSINKDPCLQSDAITFIFRNEVNEGDGTQSSY